MNDDHTFAPEMTAEEAIQMVLKRPEMYGLQRVTAVPDAGEPLTDDLEKLHGIIEQFRARGIKYKAERDAALEAIERIRQAVSGHPECDRYEEGDVISCGWKSAYASVVAALDGAPEPGWEWGFAIREHPHNSVLEASREDAERRVAKWNKYASPKNGVLVRRRKVGPWLPVEGEKP